MQEETPQNALLLLVSGDGIPLLVRSYSTVTTPPSAAVGVASALYHAAVPETDASTASVDLQLLALETRHRAVVYEMTPSHLLLVFASDRPCDGCQSNDVIVRRILRTIFHALLLLLGQRNMREWDASKLRIALSKQVDVIDIIVTRFQIDPRFIFGKPVRDVVAYRHMDDIDIGKSDSLMQGAWFENGQLVGDYFQPDRHKMLDTNELVLLTVLAECVGRREYNSTHYIGRVYLARTQVDVKVVIRNSSKGPLATFIGIFDDKVEDDDTLKEMVGSALALG
ncbi:hypothetical protein PHMEG_00017184 [Phytophthora megakarya]|uniref:Uncharacterized protein n=1 Tax=Phytophthora megakarya TaxID=4795 RepID=A0A225VXE0_9STRA|nr:hypothetical protein PHMEG_00017184 [Phytophthora megakarya]